MVQNPISGEVFYFFEYVVRATVDYSVVKFEYIVPRTGVFKNPLTSTNPSPEELATDVYVKEATLGAVQAIDVAMQPYSNRRPRGGLLESLKTAQRDGRAQHASTASAITSMRTSGRSATHHGQFRWIGASTTRIDGSPNETVARSNVATQPFSDIQAGPSLSLPTQDHHSGTISASADVTAGSGCDEERVNKSSPTEEVFDVFDVPVRKSPS